MAGVPTPQIITEAFGLNADGGTITLPIPLTTGTPGDASFDKGFSAVNMTPIAAGGVAPFGQDMNGILYMISSHCAALQAGQPYLWDSGVATAIGGYAIGSVLGMTDKSGLWFNTVDGNATDPDSGAAAGWVALYRYGSTTISTTGGTITLTAEQAKAPVIVVTGILTSNVQLIFPANQQQYLIINATAGANTVKCKLIASTGVVITQGGFAQPTGIYCNGAEIYAAYTPPGALPTSVPPNPSTIALRSNTGQIYSTQFNQNSSSTENPDIGAIFVENTAADGFLRKSALADAARQIFLAVVGGSVVPNGYFTIPVQGRQLIVQYGYHVGANTGAGLETVNLNIAYPTANLMSLVNSVRNSTGVVGTNFVYALGTTTFQAVLDRNTDGTRDCYWISLGY